jgi:hypothetical protein
VTAFTRTDETNFQKTSTFLNYMPKAGITHLFRKYEDFRSRSNEIHRRFRAGFISKRLQLVVADCWDGKNAVEDSVQKNQKRAVGFLGNEYSRVEPDECTHRFHDQEIIHLNPNSIENVKKVLDDILAQSQRSDPDRNWIVVVQDGLPYCLAMDIIRNTMICKLCFEETKDIEKHFRDIHEGRNVQCSEKYFKIVLRPGNGHYEINLVRTIFNNFFDIYLRPIAKMLGFNSPASLDYCRTASDHHKSWEILEVSTIHFAVFRH